MRKRSFVRNCGHIACVCGGCREFPAFFCFLFVVACFAHVFERSVSRLISPFDGQDPILSSYTITALMIRPFAGIWSIPFPVKNCCLSAISLFSFFSGDICWPVRSCYSPLFVPGAGQRSGFLPYPIARWLSMSCRRPVGAKA